MCCHLTVCVLVDANLLPLLQTLNTQAAVFIGSGDDIARGLQGEDDDEVCCLLFAV